MDFFSEVKNTNKKQMHLEKNTVFFKSCIAAKVAPAPVLTQIVNGKLALICYSISEDLAFAVGEQLR